MHILAGCEAPILLAPRPAARSFLRRPPGSMKSNTTAYMRATLSRSFFAISISSPSYVSRGFGRAQFCIDGTVGPFAWPRFRGQPPEPAGSRRKARGVDGESARRATIIAGHYAATVTAFLLILFSPLKFR